MMSWRPATDHEIERLWPAARAAHLSCDADQFRMMCEQARWAVRVSPAGDAMLLRPWRRRLNVLSIRAAWVARDRISNAVREGAAISREHGFTALMSPLVTGLLAEEYRKTGMDVAHKLVAFQGRPPVVAQRALELSVRGSREQLLLGEACEEDVDTLCRIDERCFDTFWRYGREEIAEALSRERVMIARIDGEMVGYSTASAMSGTCTLGRLAVVPEARRRGVGAALVADSARWAQGEGVPAVSLCTQSDNTASQALYRSLGFVEDIDRYQLLCCSTERH